MVPFYDTWNAQMVFHDVNKSIFAYALSLTNLTVILVSGENCAKLIHSEDFGNLKYVVNLDPITEELKKQYESKGIKVIEYHELIDYGKKHTVAFPKVTPETVATLAFTSGTTGVPKAAMLTQRNFTAGVAACKSHEYVNCSDKDVHFSYLPLPHLFERVFMISILFFGVHIYFFDADRTQLLAWV